MQKTYKKILLVILFYAGTSQFIIAQNTSDSSTIIVADSEVVNIGFGQQKTKLVTSAISTIKGAELQKTFSTNLGATLYGRLSGLTVMQGGNEPGNNNPSINARGNNTFGPGNNVLIIIDGFMGDYSQLVPEEIEEISLLKDASATAIYGSRAANGVILVTTKRGRIAPLQINFSTQQGFSQAERLPKFLDAANYASLYNEALANDGKAPLYTTDEITAYQNGSDPYFHPNVNWYDEVLRKTAPVANYNLSLRGGNTTAKYFVMLNNISSQGLYKNFGDMDEESRNSTYNRFNFRANIDVNLTKRLSATLLLGGSVEDKGNPGSLTTGGIFGQLASIPSNAFPVINPNGTYGAKVNASYVNPYSSLLKTGYAESNGRTLQSSFRLSYDLSMITKGLSASTVVSVNNFFTSGSNKTKGIERFAVSKNAAGDTVYSSKIGQTSSLVGSEPNLGQSRNYAIQGFLNYHRVFGKHDIYALAMFNSDNATIDKSGIFSGGASNLSLAYKNNGGGGRLTYVNNTKYIAEFSMAYMGSENYAPGNRYGFFPAASVGWIASNESFLQNNKIITFLKLRASYGLVGNDEIGGARFLYNQNYTYGDSYYFGTATTGTASLSEGALANPDVTWEKETKANIGIEATFFNRLDFTLDVFNQDRYDILITPTRTIPLYLGYTALPNLNEGKVNNKGFEAVLRYRNEEKSQLQFFVETNIFYARNKIVYNGEVIQVNKARLTEGRRIGQPFGLRALGLFATDVEASTSPTPFGLVVKAGDVKYQDIGGPAGVPDGIIDANDNQPIGNTGLPELTAGLHTGLRYKGFDLDIVIQGVTGTTVYLGSSQFRPFQNNGQAGVIALERWTPQTAATATFPRLSAYDNLNNYRYSSFYQYDGSFIKLRSVEIGYSFTKNLINKIKLQQARLFLTGTNLFSLDHIAYGNTETLGTGYPSLRTIALGARIQF